MQPVAQPANSTIFTFGRQVLRAALDAIGGFATGTVNEDTHTSLRLNARGCTAIFHPRSSRSVSRRSTRAAYYGQRQRFADGAVQILLHEPLLGAAASDGAGKTFVFHVVANIEGWRYLVIYVLPIAILLTGIVPLATNGATFLAFYIPYLAVTWVAFDVFSRGHMRVFQGAVFNLARVPSSIRATISGHRLGRRFRVTPKERRDAHAPRSVHEAFPWLVALVSCAAIAYAAVRSAAGAPLLPADALAIVSVWAAYNAATAIRLIAHTARRR